MAIDLIITYVDNTNQEWQSKYRQFPDISYTTYYRTGKDALKYLLRSIDQNLPFINTIFLIVQNESEVPNYVDISKIRVVTHEEFIPQEYLPTFNSNTIETFFGNIKDLSEYFIYINDDMLVLNHLDQSRFYTNDNKVLSYFTKVQTSSSFNELLLHNSELVYNISREQALHQNQIFVMNHTLRPYLKSVYKEFYNKYKDKLLPSLTRFRNKKNYTIYAVDLYQHLINRGLNCCTVTTKSIKNNATDEIIKQRFSSGVDTLCIFDNDGRVDIYENKTFQDLLKQHFPFKSKYER